MANSRRPYMFEQRGIDPGFSITVVNRPERLSETSSLLKRIRHNNAQSVLKILYKCFQDEQIKVDFDELYLADEWDVLIEDG